jgi:hypothetical protein
VLWFGSSWCRRMVMVVETEWWGVSEGLVVVITMLVVLW